MHGFELELGKVTSLSTITGLAKRSCGQTVMDTSPYGVAPITPYNPRQLAVFQADEAHKAAIKSGGDAKFRSVRDPVKSIRFPKDNWKKGTFYPTQTQGLRFKASEPIIDKMHSRHLGTR